MKVVIGKFSNEPFHALSKKDVSLIFKLVPKEWAINVLSVVLSSKIFKKTKLTKPIEYTPSNKQLSIYSRGLIREDIAKQVLLELAIISAVQEGADSDNSSELDIKIKPFMDKFLKAKV
jgi:hypothetical protein